jgi:hypothetical protein
LCPFRHVIHNCIYAIALFVSVALVAYIAI